MEKQGSRLTDAVEDALQTYPPAPAPGTLKTRVMRSVYTRPRIRPFSLPWLEGALGLLVTVMLTVGSFLLLGVSATDLQLLVLTVQETLFYSAYSPVVITAVAVLGLALMAVLLAAAFFAFPRPRYKRVRTNPR